MRNLGRRQSLPGRGSVVLHVKLTTMLMLTARIAALLTLASLAALFASAGLLVQDAQGLALHSAGAVGIHVFSGILAAALAARAWVTRSGVRTAAAAAALFGLSFVQAALGSYLTMALHVSGSLVVTGLSAGITFWAFTTRAH